MLISILAGLIGAFAAPSLVRGTRGWAPRLLALIPLALFVYFLRQVPTVMAGVSIIEAYDWVPGLSVRIALRLDGLGLLFALLVSGFGFLVVLYAGDYLKDHRGLGRFFLALLLFMSSMLGLVLADDLVLMFVFWELTSLSSYLLIGFDHEREQARAAALQALLVTAGGGLALLAGIVLIIVVTGSAELSALADAGSTLRQHPLYLPTLVLVAIGAFTKSAQFPFHFWLPSAMAAPTPVSAYLHSATMVKAGIYLLARLDPILGGTTAWIWMLTTAGAITMLLGSVMAFRQTDLKKVLAYSTLTALGILTVLLGLSFEASIKAAVVFLIVHALYKGALFLVTGAVDHATGTRRIPDLGGLRRAMPITALVAVLAGLSMAGLPPLFGFVGKELAYKAKLGFGASVLLLPALAVVANALNAAAAGLVTLRPFFGKASDAARRAHDPAPGMWLGPAALALAGLLFGLVPRTIAEPVVAEAVAGVLGYRIPIDLGLWYGFNLTLALSVITIALGIGAYLAWDRVQRWRGPIPWLAVHGPERAYDLGLDALLRLARWSAASLQHGRLPIYLLTVLATLLAVTGGTWLALGGRWGAAAAAGLEATHVALSAVVIVGALAAVAARSRITAVVSLGSVGFGVALLFVALGAPDLAMTQFLVETLIVIVMVLVLRSIPAPRPPQDRQGARWRDGIIAVAVGSLVAALLLAVTAGRFDPFVSEFFARESVPGGFGRNIVNVILVDFRALDTLGEITVLAIAGLAVRALFPRTVPGWPGRVDAPSPILAIAARVLLPLLLLFSLFLLWRGHNLPGGGFSGGLVAAGALALLGFAAGRDELRRVLRVPPRTVMALGLAIALGSGLLGLLAGAPFMAGLWGSITLLGAELKLGTPLLFDVGVYLTVIGFTLTLILALEDA